MESLHTKKRVPYLNKNEKFVILRKLWPKIFCTFWYRGDQNTWKIVIISQDFCYIELFYTEKWLLFYKYIACWFLILYGQHRIIQIVGNINIVHWYLLSVLSSTTIVGWGFILLFVRKSNGTGIWWFSIFGVPCVIEPIC